MWSYAWGEQQVSWSDGIGLQETGKASFLFVLQRICSQPGYFYNCCLQFPEVPGKQVAGLGRNS